MRNKKNIILASSLFLASSIACADPDFTPSQIKQLKQRVDQQQVVLDKLSKESAQTFIKQGVKKSSLLDQAKQSNALPARKIIIGTEKARLLIYGLVNQLMFLADDNKDQQLYFATNIIKNSRIGFKGELDASPNWVIGSQIEIGSKINPSDSISQSTPTSSTIDFRRVEVYASSKRWGDIYFGKGYTASDDTVNVDFSGTANIARPTASDIGGGLLFRNAVTGSLSTVAVGDVVNGLDGFSRRVRLRYDTPEIHGFSISASTIEEKRNDVNLRYVKSFDNIKFATEIAYATPVSVGSGANIAKGDELTGSVSALHTSGFSMTGASGKIYAQANSRNEPYFYYIKPGYKHNFFSAGVTALSIDFGRYFDFAQNSDKATAYGIAFMQNFDRINLALYSGYRHFQLKRPGSSFDSINLALLGVLYKF